MTVTQRILQYLETLAGANHPVCSHNIELDLPEQVFERGHIRHNPGTYSRKFRLIREKANQYGLSFETLKHGKENAWKVTIIDTLKLQQALSQTEVAA